MALFPDRFNLCIGVVSREERRRSGKLRLIVAAIAGIVANSKPKVCPLPEVERIYRLFSRKGRGHLVVDLIENLLSILVEKDFSFVLWSRGIFHDQDIRNMTELPFLRP